MLEPGAKVGPYTIIQSVGAGGGGEVYRARDERLSRDVAIKVLPEAMRSDATRLRRFEQEARAAAALNHPNILAVHDYHCAVDSAMPYLVCELLEGGSLRARLAQGPLARGTAIDYALQIARGLAAAHEAGVLHRDLKPDNLFILNDGRVKILDFGLAKEIACAPTAAPLDQTAPAAPLDHTAPGTILGTAGYMSPEQVQGRPADVRSDIFSYGAVLYEMLTHERAFGGDSSVDRAYAILKDQPRALTGLLARDPALGRVVSRALEKEPGRRFQSAQDLVFALESVGAPPRTAAPAFGGTFRYAVLGATTLVLLAGLAVAYQRETQRQTVVIERLGGVIGPPEAALAPPAPPALPLPPDLEETVSDVQALLERPRDIGRPRFERVTYRRGQVGRARFTPDGRSVVHTWTFPGHQPRVFMAMPGNPEERPITPPGSVLLGVSSQGEMALGLIKDGAKGMEGYTLARAPLAGGAPRAILDRVVAADWSPDGGELAVMIHEQGRTRIEYPLGSKLLEASMERLGFDLRVSPQGDAIAYFYYPVPNDDRGSVMLVDREGEQTTLSGPWYSLQGLAWSPDGKEVIFGAAERGANHAVYAVDREGRSRLLLTQAGPAQPVDVARDGRVLLTTEHRRSQLLAGRPGTDRERDLAWFDWSLPIGLSADGRRLLFIEGGQSTVQEIVTYLRPTDGSEDAVRLAVGYGWALSPDGEWALLSPSAPYERLLLIPTGPGMERELESGEVGTYRAATFVPDGRSIVFEAETEDSTRLWRQSLAPNARPEPLGRAGLSLTVARVSPDGKRLVARDVNFKLYLLSLKEGKEERLELPEGLWPVQWTADGKGLYVRNVPRAIPIDIKRFDLTTREVEPVRQLGTHLQPENHELGMVLLTYDAGSYVYGVGAKAQDLYVAERLW